MANYPDAHYRLRPVYGRNELVENGTEAIDFVAVPNLKSQKTQALQASDSTYMDLFYWLESIGNEYSIVSCLECHI